LGPTAGVDLVKRRKISSSYCRRPYTASNRP